MASRYSAVGGDGDVAAGTGSAAAVVALLPPASRQHQQHRVGMPTTKPPSQPTRPALRRDAAAAAGPKAAGQARRPSHTGVRPPVHHNRLAHQAADQAPHADDRSCSDGATGATVSYATQHARAYGAQRRAFGAEHGREEGSSSSTSYAVSAARRQEALRLKRERRIRAETERRRRLQREKAMRESAERKAAVARALERRKAEQAEYVQYLKSQFKQQRRRRVESVRDLPVEVFARPKARAKAGAKAGATQDATAAGGATHHHPPVGSQAPAPRTSLPAQTHRPAPDATVAATANARAHHTSTADAAALALYDRLQRRGAGEQPRSTAHNGNGNDNGNGNGNGRRGGGAGDWGAHAQAQLFDSLECSSSARASGSNGHQTKPALTVGPTGAGGTAVGTAVGDGGDVALVQGLRTPPRATTGRKHHLPDSPASSSSSSGELHTPRARRTIGASPVNVVGGGDSDSGSDGACSGSRPAISEEAATAAVPEEEAWLRCRTHSQGPSGADGGAVAAPTSSPSPQQPSHRPVGFAQATDSACLEFQRDHHAASTGKTAARVQVVLQAPRKATSGAYSTAEHRSLPLPEARTQQPRTSPIDRGDGGAGVGGGRGRGQEAGGVGAQAFPADLFDSLDMTRPDVPQRLPSHAPRHGGARAVIEVAASAGSGAGAASAMQSAAVSPIADPPAAVSSALSTSPLMAGTPPRRLGSGQQQHRGSHSGSHSGRVSPILTPGRHSVKAPATDKGGQAPGAGSDAGFAPDRTGATVAALPHRSSGGVGSHGAGVITPASHATSAAPHGAAMAAADTNEAVARGRDAGSGDAEAGSGGVGRSTAWGHQHQPDNGSAVGDAPRGQRGGGDGTGRRDDGGAHHDLRMAATKPRKHHSRRFGQSKPSRGRRKPFVDSMSVCSGYTADGPAGYGPAAAHRFGYRQQHQKATRVQGQGQAPPQARDAYSVVSGADSNSVVSGARDAHSVVSYNVAVGGSGEEGEGTVSHPVPWGRGDNRRQLAQQHALRMRRKQYEAKVRHRLRQRHLRRKQRKQQQHGDTHTSADSTNEAPSAPPPAPVGAAAAAPRPAHYAAPRVPGGVEGAQGRLVRAPGGVDAVARQEARVEASLERLNVRLARVRGHGDAAVTGGGGGAAAAAGSAAHRATQGPAAEVRIDRRAHHASNHAQSKSHAKSNMLSPRSGRAGEVSGASRGRAASQLPSRRQRHPKQAHQSSQVPQHSHRHKRLMRTRSDIAVEAAAQPTKSMIPVAAGGRYAVVGGGGGGGGGGGQHGGAVSRETSGLLPARSHAATAVSSVGSAGATGQRGATRRAPAGTLSRAEPGNPRHADHHDAAMMHRDSRGHVVVAVHNAKELLFG